jgi:hypothetical protein
VDMGYGKRCWGKNPAPPYHVQPINVIARL